MRAKTAQADRPQRERRRGRSRKAGFRKARLVNSCGQFLLVDVSNECTSPVNKMQTGFGQMLVFFVALLLWLLFFCWLGFTAVSRILCFSTPCLPWAIFFWLLMWLVAWYSWLGLGWSGLVVLLFARLVVWLCFACFGCFVRFASRCDVPVLAVG